MKKLITILLTVISFSIYSDEKPFVQIYKTHDNGLYGRSEDRDMILSVKKSIFKRFDTLEANSELNFLTAVVLDTSVVNELEKQFVGRESIQIGFVKISKDKNIYTIEDDNNFLKFSFSYEKPGEEILFVISDHYPRTSKYRKIVTDHYKENFVLRVHSAENVLMSEAREITYDEALLMATIIGDKDQWLWGIHDGANYLEELLLK